MKKLFIAVYNTEKNDSTLLETKKMAVEKIRQFAKKYPDLIVIPHLSDQKNKIDDNFNQETYVKMLRENLVWLEKKQDITKSETPVFDELAEVINQGDINVLVIPSLKESICCLEAGLNLLYLLTEGKIKYLITKDLVFSESDLEKFFNFLVEHFGLTK